MFSIFVYTKTFFPVHGGVHASAPDLGGTSEGVHAPGATVCAPLIHNLRACQPNSPICHMPPVAAFSLRRSLQGNTRGVGCVQSQAATHRTLYTAARPLANACLCEALGRQACGSFDFCTFLLKDNTAGLATALRGEQATGPRPAPAYTAVAHAQLIAQPDAVQAAG